MSGAAPRLTLSGVLGKGRQSSDLQVTITRGDRGSEVEMTWRHEHTKVIMARLVGVLMKVVASEETHLTVALILPVVYQEAERRIRKLFPEISPQSSSYWWFTPYEVEPGEDDILINVASGSLPVLKVYYLPESKPLTRKQYDEYAAAIKAKGLSMNVHYVAPYQGDNAHLLLALNGLIDDDLQKTLQTIANLCPAPTA